MGWQVIPVDFNKVRFEEKTTAKWNLAIIILLMFLKAPMEWANISDVLILNMDFYDICNLSNLLVIGLKYVSLNWMYLLKMEIIKYATLIRETWICLFLMYKSVGWVYYSDPWTLMPDIWYNLILISHSCQFFLFLSIFFA